jgi:uncharacterized membrane protein YccC
MVKMLENIRNYYKACATGFFNDQPVSFYQLHVARKNAFVSLANLSDAFTRMLSEPKRHQKGIENVHRFVVLNHTLASHVATLSYYLQTRENLFRSPAFEPVVKETIEYLNNTIEKLKTNAVLPIAFEKQSLRALNDHTETLMEKRKRELEEGLIETSTKDLLVQTKPITDQFNYIYSIAIDINKECREINLT